VDFYTECCRNTLFDTAVLPLNSKEIEPNAGPAPLCFTTTAAQVICVLRQLTLHQDVRFIDQDEKRI